MRRSDIKKLIDLDDFYSEVDRIADDCNCTHLDAAQEYGRIHMIEDDLLAQIIKVSRGKFKAKIIEQCEELRLIRVDAD